MALPKWLQIVKTVGLAALAVSPLAPIAVPVSIAIAEAEQLAGKTGAEKLEQVLKVAEAAAATAKAAGVNIDPAVVRSAGADAISTAVKVTNIVAQAKTDSAGD